MGRRPAASPPCSPGLQVSVETRFPGGRGSPWRESGSGGRVQSEEAGVGSQPTPPAHGPTLRVLRPSRAGWSGAAVEGARLLPSELF